MPKIWLDSRRKWPARQAPAAGTLQLSKPKTLVAASICFQLRGIERGDLHITGLIVEIARNYSPHHENVNVYFHF
jgi:hypothetical protein